MMYLFWFAEFIFDTMTQPLIFGVRVLGSLTDLASSASTLISSFPVWLSMPFSCLVAISVLFRVSQFIPLIGGAS